MVEYKTLSLVVLMGAVLVALALAVRFRAQVVGAVRRFFTEPGTAFNLAVFRFAFYATALVLAQVPLHTAERFAALPRGLMVPPTGFSLVSSHFPISVTLVQLAFWLTVVASVFAALGLFMRVASVVFLVAITYYLTIPEIFGKVVHYHTIVWVAALLAVSRTADVMSLDSFIRARRSKTAEIAGPAPSVAYARPIRLTWLFLAVSYLGPGLWKYRSAGLDWASASNMRAILYGKWYELGGYRPFVPVDKSGFLLFVGGLTTLAFELGFIFLIWNRYTRVLAAAGGLFFHTMNIVTLYIKFYWAMILYVTFVDWEWLSRWLLQRRETLRFAFDDSCGSCKRTVAALSSVTLPAGIEYMAAQELAAASGLPADVELSELLADVHVLTPKRSYRGFAAYRRIAWRVPFLWPFLPFLYLPPFTVVANSVYRRVADHRLCHVDKPPHEVREEPPLRVRRGWTTAPTLVGAVILAGMLAAIPGQETNAWPIALYPTFAGIHVPRSGSLVVVVRRGDNAATTVALKSCFPWMPTDRYAGLVRQTVAHARHGHTSLIRELVLAAGRDCPELTGHSETFSFYNDTVDTTPGKVGRVINRTRLLRWTGSA